MVMGSGLANLRSIKIMHNLKISHLQNSIFFQLGNSVLTPVLAACLGCSRILDPIIFAILIIKNVLVDH